MKPEQHNHAAAASVEHDPRWEMLLSRASDDGFFYSVKTTGVYCRPGCSSRLPRPENVEFHETSEQAERAGFRPCKRCRPDRERRDTARLDRIERACRLIEASEEEPRLSDIAARVNMSPFHFHRTFKSVLGLTPKAYAAAIKRQRVRDNLKSDTQITEAIFAAGYGSSSRFYERARKLLGMNASAFRAGGKAETIRYAVEDCEFGKALVAASDAGVCAIFLGDSAKALVEELAAEFPRANRQPADDAFADTVAAVLEHLENPARTLAVPLDIRGTAFQQRVWDALLDVTPGNTASYGDIATRIGNPKAARAVARACAENSLAVAVPCHRIVRSDGKVSGYRWGENLKRKLLAKERQ